MAIACGSKLPAPDVFSIANQTPDRFHREFHISGIFDETTPPYAFHAHIRTSPPSEFAPKKYKRRDISLERPRTFFNQILRCVLLPFPSSISTAIDFSTSLIL